MEDFDVLARIQELCDLRSWTYYRLAKEADIPWGTAETVKDALEKLQNNSISWFDNEAYMLVNQYLEDVQTLEISNVRQRLAQMGEYEKRKLERTFGQMGLSMIVILDEILSPEEQKLFPCRNLAERVQQGK